VRHGLTILIVACPSSDSPATLTNPPTLSTPGGKRAGKGGRDWPCGLPQPGTIRVPFLVEICSAVPILDQSFVVLLHGLVTVLRG